MVNSRRKKHCFWSSLVVTTFIGCSLVLYFSYLHEVRLRGSFENSSNSTETAEKQIQAKCPKVCSTKECVKAASFLLENMDQTADPCEEFYLFSCGGFINKFSQSDNYSTIENMSKELKLKLKDILENLKRFSSLSRKLKTLYESCIMENSSDKNTISSILEQFGISKWPYLPSNFSFVSSSLERTLGKIAAANEFSFAKFKITYHELREYNHTGLLNLTIHSISPLMRAQSVSGVYKNMILRILNYFEINSELTNGIWEEFLKVDGAVLQLYVAYSDSWQNEEEPKYVHCDNETSDIETSICTLLENFIESSDLQRKFSKSHVYIEEVQFMEHLFPTLRNFTHTSLANYLSLRFILEHLEELDIIFRVTMLTNPEVYSLETDYKVVMDRWEICVDWISKYMPYSLGKRYAITEFSESQLQEMHDIVQTYFEEAGVYIMKINWINETHREQLKAMTKALNSNLDYYIDVLLNGSNFNSLFEGFQPTKESFLQNVVKYRKHVLTFVLQNFHMDARERFPSDLFAVNAYHFAGNLLLSFGMFLPPVYQHGRPKLLNLMSLGPTIGHEIGHEIETYLDYRVLYNETKRTYQEKRNCLEEQFFGYDVQKIDRKLKGNRTLHENLADLIGMEISQQVMDRYIKEANADSQVLLPSLNFTTQQFAYIYASQMWCSVRSKEKEQLHYQENSHSPPEIRITSMLRNLNEFTKTFSCVSGSNMNPVQRCSFRD